VDVGQVEGAFIMGLGLFTTEFMQYDEHTGEKLVTGTWVSVLTWVRERIHAGE
jgi:xanthine dehydrogenase molybdopterin-binding subunit B